MKIIKNPIISWGVRGVLIGIALILVPGGLRVAFWPLFLASSITGDPKPFFSVIGFGALPNVAGAVILIVGWFLIGAIFGYFLNKFSKKNAAY